MKKWRKVFLWSCVGLIMIVLGFFLYMLFIFEMFPVNKEHLITLAIPERNYKISAFYVDAGAASGNTIQLQKIYDSGKFEIVKNISGYTDVKTIERVSEKTLKVVLGFKAESSTRRDTVLVEVE